MSPRGIHNPFLPPNTGQSPSATSPVPCRVPHPCLFLPIELLKPQPGCLLPTFPNLILSLHSCHCALSQSTARQIIQGAISLHIRSLTVCAMCPWSSVSGLLTATKCPRAPPSLPFGFRWLLSQRCLLKSSPLTKSILQDPAQVILLAGHDLFLFLTLVAQVS